MISRLVLALAIVFNPAFVHAADVVLATKRFELRSEPRDNLHHFLIAWAAADHGAWPPYATAVAERDTWRAFLGVADHLAWAAAVDVYAATPY